MNGLNTARGDFIPGGDGILSPGGASVPGEKSPGGDGKSGGGGGNVPPHRLKAPKGDELPRNGPWLSLRNLLLRVGT